MTTVTVTRVHASARVDAATWQRIENLFFQALALPDPQRRAFCARVAVDDRGIGDQLTTLLDAHAAEAGVLDRSPLAAAHATAGPEELAEGTRIGVWRLGALIGRGGAGVTRASYRKCVAVPAAGSCCCKGPTARPAWIDRRRNTMHIPSRPIARGLALAWMIAAGATAAQSSVTGPYYATPSWDQTLPSATRFLVLANFGGLAVLDRETGLVWERSPGTARVPLYAAVLGCSQSRTGNRTGWRLPTIAELGSLFDPSAGGAPFLPAGHPFTGFDPVAAEFWSTSRVTVTVPGFTATNLLAAYAGPSYASAVVADATRAASYLCLRGPGGTFSN